MTKETEAFLRKAQRTLDGSNLLLSQGFPEQAAGEAYYVMFYAAKAMLLEAGQKATKHKHVAREFQDLFVASGRVEAKYQRFLEQGFKTRHFAVYETDLAYGISTEAAKVTVAQAADFVDMAKRFLKGA